MAYNELSIKNDALADILNRVMETKDGYDFDGKTDKENGEEMVAEYALDMIKSGYAAGVEPDFIYDTIGTLPVAAASCYRRDKETYGEPSAVIGTVKAIAAFFLVLAMNEHGIAWDVRRRPVPLNPSRPQDPLWSVFRITSGERKQSDFLIPVSAGCAVTNIAGKDMVTFDLAPLIKEYKAVTGVDLGRLGLKNIMFDR